MIRGSGCGTCPRSGTLPAPARSAGSPPPGATSSTTPPTRQAGGPACATPVRSAGTITGSSSSPDGPSISFPTAPSGGPPRPGAPTPPSPPAIRSSRRGDGERRGTALRFPASPRWGGAVMAGPGDEIAADREQVIEVLKAAFVHERLAKDEFDLRVGRALAARTHAELAVVTASLPAELTSARPPTPARARSEPPIVRPGPLITVATAVCAGVWM